MSWKGIQNNNSPNDIQENVNVSDKRIQSTIEATANRAENVRRDLDTTKNITISLLDIDTAILDYIDKTINVHIMDNGNNIKLPVIYASPERWKAIQVDGVLRDGQGKLQFPILTFGRTSIAKRQEMMSPNRHLTYPVITKYTEKNKYNPTWTLGNEAPVYKVHAVTIPDYVTLTYEMICQSEYVEQMNVIIQKINWASEDYWGDKKRFRFKVTMGDYSLSTETGADKDRVVKATFSLTVNAYLLEESFEDKKLTTDMVLTKKVVKIGMETVVDAKTMQSIGKKESSPFPYEYKNGNIKRDDLTLIPAPVKLIDTNDLESIKRAYEQLTLTTVNPEVATLWHNPPTNSTDYGEEGWLSFDKNYLYVYTNNRWLRTSISTFQPFD